MTREDLKDAIKEALIEHRSIDAATHAMHHDFVADMIERRRRRLDRWEKVRVHIYGWGAVTLLGAAIYAIGNHARSWLTGSGP